MRGRYLAHVAAAAACMGAACSLTTSLDGLTGGTGDGGTSTDGAASDAAGTDGSVALDGDAGSFCDRQTPKPLFCADFDEGPTSIDLAHWNGVDVNPADAGRVTLDPSTASSPPASLLATFAGAPGGGGASLFKQVTASSPSAVRLDVAIRVDDLGSATGGTDVVLINFGQDASGDSPYGFELALSSTGAYVIESFAVDGGGVQYYQHDFQGMPPQGQWSKMTVSLDFTTRALSGSIDGVVLLNETVQPEARTGPVSLAAGFEYTPSTVPISLHLDDLVVSAPP